MSARRGIGILGHWAGMTDAESERAAGQIYARALREAADSESWGDDRREWLVVGVRGNLRRLADKAEGGEGGVR